MKSPEFCVIVLTAQHQRNCVCFSVWKIDINAEDDVNNVVIKPFYLGKQRELGLNEILYFVSGGAGKSVLRLFRLNGGVVLDLALK